jgi:hypothetical protein
MLLGAGVRAQQPAVAPIDRMREAVASLMNHYEPSQGLWNTEGWWNAANSTTEIGEAAAVDPSKKYSETMQTTFEKARSASVDSQRPHPRFYQRLLRR